MQCKHTQSGLVPLLLTLTCLLSGVSCNGGHGHGHSDHTHGDTGHGHSHSGHGHGGHVHGVGEEDSGLGGDLAALIQSFGLSVLGKDQESATDPQPTEDHSHLNVQAIIEELFHPSTAPTSTPSPSTRSPSTGPLPLQEHLHSMSQTTSAPVYLTETHYYLGEDDKETFSPLQPVRNSLEPISTQLTDKPTMEVVDTRLANFLLVNRDKRPRRRKELELTRENNILSQPGQIHTLSFKGSTQAPFILKFFLDKEEEEQGRQDGEHPDPGERNGEVAAWEENGTMWRLDPSHGQEILGVPALIGHEKGVHPMVQESFIQTQIKRQQEESLRRNNKKHFHEERDGDNANIEEVREGSKRVSHLAGRILLEGRRHEFRTGVQESSVKEVRGKGRNGRGRQDRGKGEREGRKHSNTRNGGKDRRKTKQEDRKHSPATPRPPDSGQSKEKGRGVRCEDGKDGLHADIQSGCQKFYMCHSGKQSGKFSCPGGTKFSEELAVCDWGGKVDCVSLTP